MPGPYRRSLVPFRHDVRTLMDDMENRLYSLAPFMSDISVPSFISGTRMDLHVDVREQEDTVTVYADVPGCEKESVKVRLLDPRRLKISCARSEEKEEDSEGYYIKERFSGSVVREVPLPAYVVLDDVKATFKEGVLEVQLKKRAGEDKGDIEIL